MPWFEVKAGEQSVWSFIELERLAVSLKVEIEISFFIPFSIYLAFDMYVVVHVKNMVFFVHSFFQEFKDCQLYT